MTPPERAEKIMDVFGSYALDRCTQADVEKEIAAQIEEAEKEAFYAGQSDCKTDGPCRTAYEKGRAEALEEAAGIVRNYYGEGQLEIAERIRAMEIEK